MEEQKYSEAEKRIIANLRLNSSSASNGSGEKADGKSLATLKKSRNEVLRRVRELKTHIADLQRQEDEVLREVSKIVILLWFISYARRQLVAPLINPQIWILTATLCLNH